MQSMSAHFEEVKAASTEGENIPACAKGKERPGLPAGATAGRNTPFNRQSQLQQTTEPMMTVEEYDREMQAAKLAAESDLQKVKAMYEAIIEQ